MSVNIGYTLTPITNTAGDRSGLRIQHASNTTAYDKAWRMNGPISLYVEPSPDGVVANTIYYISSIKSQLSFKLSEIAKINNGDPNATDYMATYLLLDAIMPNS